MTWRPQEPSCPEVTLDMYENNYFYPFMTDKVDDCYGFGVQHLFNNGEQGAVSVIRNSCSYGRSEPDLWEAAIIKADGRVPDNSVEGRLTRRQVVEYLAAAGVSPVSPFINTNTP